MVLMLIIPVTRPVESLCSLEEKVTCQIENFCLVLDEMIRATEDISLNRSNLKLTPVV